MPDLIISPFLDSHLVLYPGRAGAIKLPRSRYAQLLSAEANEAPPAWLAAAVSRMWQVDISARPLSETATVRAASPLGYGKASYELNMGCNYECEHCYLGLKQFAGLEWDDRERVLAAMRDAGVLWLQLTGGEPTIDRLFPETYAHGYDLGMMIEILTNGSRLASPAILELMTSRPPHRVVISVYGATEATYDGLTQRRGSYKLFMRGLDAACGAGIPVDLSMVVTARNYGELDAMHALADERGLSYRDYTRMSPTIYGGAETLSSQTAEHLIPTEVFTGCNAGHTSFHVDPYGKASICKVGREPNIDLISEGVSGLYRLGGIADQLLQRQGGCAGCSLSSKCVTCMPLAAQYRAAKAPLAHYCQHRERG